MLRNNLAKLMIDRGITATQLFNDTGIARSTISKISNNNTDKISLYTIDKICNYLEVSPSDFFDFWPYDVEVKTGFIDYDSLDEIFRDFRNFSSPTKGYLSIIFKKGNSIKKIFDFSLLYYAVRQSVDDPFYDGYSCKIEDIEPETGTNDSIAFLNEIPIQFKNEVIKKIEEVLISTFNAYIDSKNIEKLFSKP